VKSAHDCAVGGLAVALAECCMGSGATGGAQTAAPPPPLGAAIDLSAALTGAAERAGAAQDAGLRDDVALFGEGPSRIVVTCAPEHLAAYESLPARLA
jgi:phosphoribosylformylglycinamidine (FGAM) synthase-like enzyme